MPLLSACLLAVLCALMPALGESQILVQTGRYTALAPDPTDAQQEPLRRIVVFDFPKGVATVGEAFEHILSGTGYALSEVAYGNVAVLGLFARPLPDVQRRLGPVSVATALQTLAGPTFQLVIDPVHRLVTFELAPNARDLGFEADQNDGGA